MKKMNKEHYQFRTLTGYDEIVVHLSGRAGEWLARTTKTNDGYFVSHRTLLHDLLSRMQLSAVASEGFRRPLQLREGQAQYSECLLQSQWNIGRKVVRRLLDEMEHLGLVHMEKSTVASTLVFPFIKGWSLDGRLIKNPFYCFYEQEVEKGEKL